MEQTQLVEGAVVWQFMLEAHRRDLAMIEQGDPVVQRTIKHEGRAHQHRRAAARGRLCQPLELGGRPLDQRWLEHQILGRIADQVELGKDDQVAVPRSLARGQNAGSITRDIADRLVMLGQGDLQRIGHGAVMPPGAGACKGWAAFA